ncbi:MAG: hypothetical protein ACI8RZ_005981, partial [Myxococcota bacterium]
GPQTPFLDCSNQQLALSLLPAIPQAGFQYLNFPIFKNDDGAAGLAWIRKPPASNALIAVDEGLKLRVGRGRDSERVVVAEALTGSETWAVVLSEGSVSVWGLSNGDADPR